MTGEFPSLLKVSKSPAEKIEVVFIPLLAFDKKGNRIGYGKGFYDRFLSECTKMSLK